MSADTSLNKLPGAATAAMAATRWKQQRRRPNEQHLNSAAESDGGTTGSRIQLRDQLRMASTGAIDSSLIYRD